MKDFVFLALNVLIKSFVSSTQDFPPDVSCDMELLTWQEAMENCQNESGQMLPFVTGLGQNIDKFHLKGETDLWTADFLIHSDNETDEFCRFNYLNRTFYEIREVLYGDCNANRNYFCKTETGVLDVYNSTRDNVHCNYTVNVTDIERMRSKIKPGYYWNSGTLHGAAEIATRTLDNINMSDILCGAYKSSIGMNYANCMEKRYSLCLRNENVAMNKTCFVGQTTKVTKRTTAVFKTTVTPTIVRKETTADESDISTKQPMTVLTSNIDKTILNEINLQEEKQSSDLWVNVGVPLGVVLPLTLGITIIIYIYRKRLQKRERRRNDHPMNITNLTTVSGQSNYETLQRKQWDEHQYGSARQVHKERVGVNTFINDVVYREDT